MRPQVLQRQDDGQAEQRPKRDAESTPSADVLDGRIAGCGIDEGAVQQEGRPVFAEDEPALRLVGQGAVAVECVVPVIQPRPVKVDAVDDRVGGVVSIRKRKEISCRKEQHGGGFFLVPIRAGCGFGRARQRDRVDGPFS